MSKIKALLKMKGMSQTDLAQELGVDRKTVFRWTGKEPEPQWVIDYLQGIPSGMQVSEVAEAIGKIGSLAEQIAAVVRELQAKLQR